jgi:hypothetical protein
MTVSVQLDGRSGSTKAQGAEGEEMKRQIAKGLAMLMVTLAFAAASAAVANGQGKARIAAQVPFEFVVADRALRAGEYQVAPIGQQGDTVEVMGGGETALRNTSPRERRGTLDAKLVFHKYGSTYFLSQVWMAGEATGRELAKSKQERGMKRELKKIASYHGDTGPLFEVVEVIATAR